MTVTRLTGGLTPGDAGDPRTFPEIFNAAADVIDALELPITADRIADGAVTAPKLAKTAGAVMVFDDATARATAIPTPVEGMVTYLKDTNLVQAFTGSAFTAVGGILQVVSGTTTTAATNSSGTFVTTNLSATITPTATSSKILVLTSQIFLTANETSHALSARLLRDSTVLVENTRAAAHATIVTFTYANTHSFNFLDSPATVSSLTYSTEFARTSGSGASLVNFAGTPAFITLMEVAG